MDQLVLTEDQELLAKTALDYVQANSPISRMRDLRDSGDPTGFSRTLWQEMAELGWVGILIPEDHGGAEMGLADIGVIIATARLLIGNTDNLFPSRNTWQPGLFLVLTACTGEQLSG